MVALTAILNGDKNEEGTSYVAYKELYLCLQPVLISNRKENHIAISYLIASSLI